MIHSARRTTVAGTPRAVSEKQPLIKPYVIIAAFLVAFTAMSFTLVKSVVNLHSAKRQESQLTQQLEAARVLTEELLAKKAFMQTDDYIEREARIEYGLSRPGTIRYAFDNLPFAYEDGAINASTQVDYYEDAGI